MDGKVVVVVVQGGIGRCFVTLHLWITCVCKCE